MLQGPTSPRSAKSPHHPCNMRSNMGSIWPWHAISILQTIHPCGVAERRKVSKANVGLDTSTTNLWRRNFSHSLLLFLSILFLYTLYYSLLSLDFLLSILFLSICFILCSISIIFLYSIFYILFLFSFLLFFHSSCHSFSLFPSCLVATPQVMGITGAVGPFSQRNLCDVAVAAPERGKRCSEDQEKSVTKRSEIFSPVVKQKWLRDCKVQTQERKRRRNPTYRKEAKPYRKQKQGKIKTKNEQKKHNKKYRINLNKTTRKTKKERKAKVHQ